MQGYYEKNEHYIYCDNSAGRCAVHSCTVLEDESNLQYCLAVNLESYNHDMPSISS